MINSTVTRRGLLAGAAGLAAASTLGACASGKKPDAGGTGKKLTITVTPFAGADLGVMPKEFAKDYMDSHPTVDIKLDDTLLFTKQTAQWAADKTKPLCNLAFSNAGSTAAGKATGMYMKLDPDQIPNAGKVSEDLTDPDWVGMPLGADQLGLLYNTEGLTPAPTSWSRLWAEDMTGKLCFFTMPWEAIGMASVLSGGGWTDFDPGFEIWASRAKNIRTIVSANPQYLNVLSTGEAVLTSHYHGTSQVWKAGGAPLEFASPEEGTVLVPVGVNINAGSSEDQIEVMYDMINEMLSPKWNQRWADLSLEMPANSEVELTDKLKAHPAIAKGMDQKFQLVDWGVLGKNTAAWTKRWESDVVAKI
ncbi:PotD/PotF family extracellular solute-binding protein [Microlunatus sp. GCM10028923]|uniref:ABC transporter substrate-binding protein n=1 Tax=Microlunatus sp. GCM10028923 TaxID=3273400 RepID=UPI003621C838